MQDERLTEKIIGCSYKVHNALGPGYLEKVYENALRIELEREGLNVRQQEPIAVHYEGQVDVGLLINFGPSSVKAKRKHRVYKPKQNAQS
jgi:hypothetical protein